MPTIIKDLLAALLKGNELLGEGERPLKLQFLRSGPQGTAWDTSFPVKVEIKNSWTLPKKELRKIGQGPYPLSLASYLKLTGSTNEDPWILDANLQRLSGPGQLLEGILIRFLHLNAKSNNYWMSETFNGVNIFGNEEVCILDWEEKRYFRALMGRPPTIKRFIIKTLAKGADPLSTQGYPRMPLYQDTTPLGVFLEKHDLLGLWSVDGERQDWMEEIAESPAYFTKQVEEMVRQKLAPEEWEERLAKVKVIVDEIIRDGRE
jgi:hypothetical protein